MTNNNKTLPKQAQQTILKYAFLRWESAMIIALTMISTLGVALFISPIPAVGALLFGVLAEALIVYSSLNDKKANRQLVDKMLQAKFQPEQLQSIELQQKIKQTLDYRHRIEITLAKRSHSLVKESLDEIAQQIDIWLKNIYTLVKRLDDYQEEKTFLETDRERISQRIIELQQQLTPERDPHVKKQLQLTINSLHRQLKSVESWENCMERANLQLEHTLSALGTIYSQILLTDVKNISSAQPTRQLRQSIAAEVNQLDDILSAMDEVYAEEIIT